MSKRPKHFAEYAGMNEPVPGVFVETGSAVYIVDDVGEVVSWNADEWAEDPESVTGMVNAVALAAVKGAAAVRQNIGLHGHVLKQLMHETAGRIATEKR